MTEEINAGVRESSGVWAVGRDSAYAPPERLDPGHRGGGGAWRVVMWVALIVACGLIFTVRVVEKAGTGVMPDPATVPSPVLKFLGRYALGVNSLAPGGPTSAQFVESIDDAALHIIDRVRAVAVAGELGGASEALDRLSALEQEIDASRADGVVPTGVQSGAGAGAAPLVFADEAARSAMRDDVATLRAIYEAGSAAGVDAAARDGLVKRHAWFGEVALAFGAPASDAGRARIEEQSRLTLVAMFAVLVVIVAAMATGFMLFITAAVFLAQNRLRSGWLIVERSGVVGAVAGGAPAGAAASADLETAVLFLWGFIAMLVIGSAVHAATGADVTAPLALGMSLICLWPLARGWTWRAWRYAAGWHTGRGFFREAGAGMLGYLAGLPIVGVGVLLTLLVTMLTGSDASHPIAGEVDVSNIWAMVGLYALATVWAPLVEESVFRGALYRHLRARVACPIAALVCGLVFAIIHPQGIAGVPVLTAMGVVFCLIREWRGSLVGAMVAHALNNFFAVSVLMVVMG